MQFVILTIAIVFTAIITGLCVFLVLKPQLVATEERNEFIREENQKALKEYEQLEKDNQQLISEKLILLDQKDIIENETKRLSAEKDTILSNIDILNNNIKTLEEQSKTTAETYYNLQMEIAQHKLNEEIVKATNAKNENIEQFQLEYDEIVQDTLKEFRELQNNVSEMRSIHSAAVEAFKRAEELRTQQDFYRICLDEIDINEIEALRSIEHLLRNKEPLNKIIWKCYYEKPTTDMIGRVVGSGTHTGIYKITEISSGKCYVGQAANIAERWKQHIKRGIGAETPTRNKLYPAMNAAGPENFTFEVIEVCDRSLLDEREDYWQDYFKAKEFGYSIK